MQLNAEKMLYLYVILVKNYIECNKSSVNLCVWILLRKQWKAESGLFSHFSSSRVKFTIFFYFSPNLGLAPPLANICSCTKFAEGHLDGPAFPSDWCYS